MLSFSLHSQVKKVFVSTSSNPILNTGTTYTGSGNSWENAYTNLLTAFQTNMAGYTSLEVYIKEGDYYNTDGTNSSFGGNFSTLPNGVNVTVSGGYSALLTGTDTSGYNPATNPTNFIKSTSLFQVGKTDGNLTVKGLNIYDPGDYYSLSAASYVGPVFNIDRAAGTFIFDDVKVLITQPVSDDPGIGIFNINNDNNADNQIFLKNVLVDGTREKGVITAREQANRTLIEIRDSQFTNNRVTVVPGAVIGLTRSANNTVRIYNSIFYNNEAFLLNGGAIALDDSSTLLVEDSKFKQNKGTGNGQGGAIAASGSVNFTSRRNTYACNHVNEGQGGAIWIDNNSTLNSENDTFVANYVNSAAGTISANAQAVGGGAVAVFGSTATVANAKFTNNYSSHLGGAILNRNSTVNVTNNEFFGNHINAPSVDASRGGAINSGNNSNLTVSNSKFQNNYIQVSSLATVKNGGAIASEDSNLTITGNSVANSWFRDNRAAGAGGAIWTSGNRAYTIANTGFYENQSGFDGERNTNGGGALFFTGSNQGISITNSDFFGNSTWVIDGSNGGGAIKVDGSGTTTADNIAVFTNNRFKDNRRNAGLNTANISGGSDIKMYYAKIEIATGTILQMASGQYNDDFPTSGVTYNGQTIITLPTYPSLSPAVSTCDQVIIPLLPTIILIANDDFYDGSSVAGHYALIPPGTSSAVLVLNNDI